LHDANIASFGKWMSLSESQDQASALVADSPPF